jgi:3-oxoacyl-[acyl-carrier protein] reductase
MNKPLALVTGVGRSVGIAAGIAEQLASDGWDLALNYWSPYDKRMSRGTIPSGFQELVNELSDRGAAVMQLPGDLALVDTAAALFRSIAEAGRVASALVLAHCESVDSGILNTTVESFDRHYAVNVRSIWQLIREFALHLPASGGRIVALTSDHTVGNLPYGASKAALDRIVLASARELADRHIVANVINPGPIDTGWMNEDVRQACIMRQPSGRLGTPADIANFVSFLLSDRGDWINGQLIKVDGGFSA